MRTGYYSTAENPYEHHCLHITSDSTCVYLESTCISDIYAEGKYRIVNNKLTVRFLTDTTRSTGKIDRKHTKATDSVNVRILTYRKRDNSKLKKPLAWFQEQGGWQIRNIFPDSAGNITFKLSRSATPLRITILERPHRLKNLTLDLVPDSDLRITAYLSDQAGGGRIGGINLDHPLEFTIQRSAEETEQLSQKIGDHTIIYHFIRE